MNRAGLVLGLLSLVAVACGGPPRSPTAPLGQQKAGGAATAHEEVHERIVPHACAARAKLAQLFGKKSQPPALLAAEPGESAPPPSTGGAPGGAKLAASQAYRVVAPATVLIRTEHGLGTGVIIDPKGYVLTNFHIVGDGQKKDFITTVNVTLGDITATGRMTRQEKSYDAVVVKADPVRDLAIVKLKEPPAKLETVKLAGSAPQIGEKVMSIGNAGIGFLWAAKSCSIASIGERQQDTSMLAALDCERIDPAASATEATRQKARCTEQKKMMTDALASTTQGLALQTDCAITHGDSGGPLVNTSGEMVGLNQSIAADVATASFHVHLDEIRDFTSKYPSEASAILPDPFCDGGADATLEDIDLDGVPDTLVTKGSAGILGGYDRISLLIDLDQDHFSKQTDPNQAFDTEVALLKIREVSYLWYDIDGDSHFDLLLVDKDSDGKPENAYRIDGAGKVTEDKSALPNHDFSSKLVKNPALHARLAKIATAIGATKYVSKRMLAAASKTTALPDAILGGGTDGRVLDTDGDGKPDVAVMRATFSRGLLIDADQDSLGSLKPGDEADAIVKAKKIDPEISIIAEGNTVWAMYDTNNDAKFDLALMAAPGADPTSLMAMNAWRLSPGGEMTPAPDQLGRRILRPGLVAFPRVVGALRASQGEIAEDEGMGTLPNPFAFHGRYASQEIAGFPANTLVHAYSETGSVMLFDVDHDTKVPPKTEIATVVAEGKFDAEVAIVHHSTDGGGSDWIYYDTDGDGKFDFVLFVATSGEAPVQAYRLVKGTGAKGTPSAIEADPAAVAGRTLRTKSVFKNAALATKWKAIATKMFSVSSIEN